MLRSSTEELRRRLLWRTRESFHHFKTAGHVQQEECIYKFLIGLRSGGDLQPSMYTLFLQRTYTYVQKVFHQTLLFYS